MTQFCCLAKDNNMQYCKIYVKQNYKIVFGFHIIGLQDRTVDSVDILILNKAYGVERYFGLNGLSPFKYSGANLNAVNNDGKTVLSEAASSWHFSMDKTLNQF